MSDLTVFIETAIVGMGLNCIVFTLTLVIGRPPETRQKTATVSQRGRCLASFPLVT